MSQHSDANWRNVISGGLNNLRFDPGRATVPLVTTTGAFPPFLSLACGTTTQGDLYNWGIHSLYRFSDPVKNQGYYARECQVRFDVVMPVEISVTSQDFEPYAILVRDSGHRWSSQDGLIVVDVTADITGPFTLEVTSVDKFQTGHFEVHVSCNPVALNPAWLRAYQYFDHATQLLMQPADFTAAYRQMRDALNAYDMTTLTPWTSNVARYDGVSFGIEYTRGGLRSVFNSVGALFYYYAYYLWTVGFQGNEYYMVIDRSTEDVLDPLIVPQTLPPWTVVNYKSNFMLGMAGLILPPNPIPFGSNPGAPLDNTLVYTPYYSEISRYTTSSSNIDLRVPTSVDPDLKLFRDVDGNEIDPQAVGGPLPEALNTVLYGWNV